LRDIVYIEGKKYHNELVLNRPEKLNAFSPELVIKFHQALVQLQAAEPKLLIIKGAGNNFSSGHDVDTVISKDNFEQFENQLKILQEITEMIVSYEAPVIAQVEGYALGAGCEIALNCDLVYASEDAVLGFPELDVGLSITQGSSYLLQKLVGPQKAKELIYFRKNIRATEAWELGLINEVIKKENITSSIEKKIEKLAKVKINSMSSVKKLFNYSAEHSLAESMKKESETLISLLR